MYFTQVLEAVLFTKVSAGVTRVKSCIQEEMQSFETLSAEDGHMGGEQVPCTLNLPCSETQACLESSWIGEINLKILVHSPEAASPSHKRYHLHEHHYITKKRAKIKEHLSFLKMSLEAFRRAGSVIDTDRQSEVPVSTP